MKIKKTNVGETRIIRLVQPVAVKERGRLFICPMEVPGMNRGVTVQVLIDHSPAETKLVVTAMVSAIARSKAPKKKPVKKK